MKKIIIVRLGIKECLLIGLFSGIGAVLAMATFVWVAEVLF